VKPVRAAIGLVGILLLAGRADAASPADERTCAINLVNGVLAVGGFVEATGFAVEPRGAPVSKVQLTLDRTRSGEATLSGLRPDVLAHFNRPDFLWSGWSGRISLEKVTPGRHTVEMTAYSHSGEAIPCGTREIQVLAAASPPERPSALIALEMLGRLALFLAGISILGLGPAVATGRGPVSLRAPFLGLAIFAITAEAGAGLGLRPLVSALFPAGLSLLLLALPGTRRRWRPRRPASGTLATLVCAAIFALVGAAVLSSHGEGVVLGDIDDAIRECSVADSMSRYGPTPPADAPGYVGGMTREARRAGLRPGGSYLLSALGQASGVRSHAVHSVAALGAGVLVVVGAGLLASRALRGFPRWRWLPAALAAVNSILYATLASQHLGSLLFAALFVGFLFHLLVLARSRSALPIVPVAVFAAAAWTDYPEGIATWGVAGVLVLFLASRERRRRTFLRLAAAALLSVALNPIGLANGLRSLSKISGEWAKATPYARETAGDTHYFPSLNVVAGTIAYREDAPAPLGRVRSVLVPVVSILIAGVSLLAWWRLTRREKWLVALLLVPVAVALAVNLRLHFPYGFAKYLPLAVPLWAVVFSLFALRAAAGPGIAVRGLAVVSLLLVGVLSLPAARHVVTRILRMVPAYDPGYRALPSLAATVDRTAVLSVDEPVRARLEWMKYFLGDNRVDTYSSEALKQPNLIAPVAGDGRQGRFLVVDRRKASGGLPAAALAASRDFAHVPAGGGAAPP
jgi:hypothetical protein